MAAPGFRAPPQSFILTAIKVRKTVSDLNRLSRSACRRNVALFATSYRVIHQIINFSRLLLVFGYRTLIVSATSPMEFVK